MGITVITGDALRAAERWVNELKWATDLKDLILSASAAQDLLNRYDSEKVTLESQIEKHHDFLSNLESRVKIAQEEMSQSLRKFQAGLTAQIEEAKARAQSAMQEWNDKAGEAKTTFEQQEREQVARMAQMQGEESELRQQLLNTRVQLRALKTGIPEN